MLVWQYRQVGNAWSSVGARLVAMPLGQIIAPLAYTSLEENVVIALPPAWNSYGGFPHVLMLGLPALVLMLGLPALVQGRLAPL